MASGPSSVGRSRADADSDVYTVLLLVAFLSLLLATIYVGYRAVSLFGGLLPPGGA
jgi:hypothetical protein